MGQKGPGGAPKKDKSQARTILAKTYLNEAEHKRFERARAQTGLGQSAYIRDMVLREHAPQPVQVDGIRLGNELGRMGSNINQSAQALNKIVLQLVRMNENLESGQSTAYVAPHTLENIQRQADNIEGKMDALFDEIKLLKQMLQKR